MTKRGKLIVVLLVVVVIVCGLAFWIVRNTSIIGFGEPKQDSVSEPWNDPVDQPPPAGFSYGEADPDQPPVSRDQVVARADKYYIDKLGEANFRKYYERLSERDAFSSLPESAFDFIGYLSKIDQINGYDTIQYEKPSDAVEYIQVNRTNLKEVYGTAPDCMADTSQCDFRVTRQQAVDIARKRGLGGELFVATVITNDNNRHRYVLKVTSCDDHKALHIDYSNGRVIRAIKGCEPIIFDDFGGGTED